jgi:hypothetical protein
MAVAGESISPSEAHCDNPSWRVGPSLKQRLTLGRCSRPRPREVLNLMQFSLPAAVPTERPPLRDEGGASSSQMLVWLPIFPLSVAPDLRNQRLESWR